MNIPPNPLHPLSRLVERADAKDRARDEARRIRDSAARQRKLQAARVRRQRETAAADYQNRMERLRPTVQPPQLRKGATRA